MSILWIPTATLIATLVYKTNLNKGALTGFRIQDSNGKDGNVTVSRNGSVAAGRTINS